MRTKKYLKRALRLLWLAAFSYLLATYYFPKQFFLPVADLRYHRFLSIGILLFPMVLSLLYLLKQRRYRKKLLSLDMNGIDRLSGYDFEYFLYYFFKKKKLKVKITSYTHDFGADLIVKYRRKKLIIQAKRWNDNVGIKAVQETIGAMSYYKATNGVVITNSFYTLSAIELAKASEVVLVNRPQLASLLNADAKTTIATLFGESPEVQKGMDRCPVCGSRMVLRHGRYGYFYGCVRYPDCNYTAREDVKIS